MRFGVIQGLVLRYLFLYTRNVVRVLELIFWPMMDLLVWGYLMRSLEAGELTSVAKPLGYLLGGMILWDVLFRSQQGVAISFLEDVWTRNLLNVFVAPVRMIEYLAATFVVGLIRIAVTVSVLAVSAFVIYDYSMMAMGWTLLPFFANLLFFGWSLGMISTALIMRWGQAAEAMAWAVPFFIQPFVAVFYPVEVLPDWLEKIALCLPATHVFEGMRGVLFGEGFDWGHFYGALLWNGVFACLAGLVFAMTLRSVKRQGLLTKVTSH